MPPIGADAAKIADLALFGAVRRVHALA